VEFYVTEGRIAFNDVLVAKLFPIGFYDDNTCMFAIDECMKKRKVIGSEIYVSN
jgi:hypothetical protein